MPSSLFSGTVRDHAEGRDGVEHLTYEAYDEAVVRALRGDRRRGPARAGRRSGGSRCSIASGRSQLGESSVVVVVSTPHRAEAFEAGRFAIDTLKASVPIWKHETWRDGSRLGHGRHADRRRRDRRVTGRVVIVDRRLVAVGRRSSSPCIVVRPAPVAHARRRGRRSSARSTPCRRRPARPVVDRVQQLEDDDGAEPSAVDEDASERAANATARVGRIDGS